MLSCFASLLLTTAAGQATPEAAWLKAVPADVPVVVRGRALDAVRDDLVAMIAAMSPDSAETAKEGLGAGLRSAEGMFGKAALKGPFLAMLRLPDPEMPAAPEWAVILKADDYDAAIQDLTIEGGEKPKPLGGYDSFAGKDGQTWYAAKGDGWVAFGPSQSLIMSVRKPRGSLDVRLSPAMKAGLLAGDVGVYVDLVAVQGRYGEILKRMTPTLVDLAQQANPEQGGQSAKGAEAMVAGLAALMKVGDGLVLNLDFEATAFTLSGNATVKAGTPRAKARMTSGDLMAKLPADMMIYIASEDSAPSPPGPKGLFAPVDSRAADKAVAARQKALEGRQVLGLALIPMRVVSLADPSDPAAAVKASIDAKKAGQGREAGETPIEPDAMAYGGFRLGRIRTKIDPKAIEKVKAAQGNVPNFDDAVKLILPGESITEYVGTDGKYFLSTVAPADDQIKAQIDAIEDDSRNLGGLASWKALRARLPKAATVFVVLNAQEAVKMILAAVSVMDKDAAARPPADLPRAAALLGFALASSPAGHEFRLVVPSDVGPVFEKGLAPLGDD